MAQRSVLKALGPGILFAGAAIGVSHLSQSTRAGAAYGLSMLFVVIVASAIKYPAFSFGPRYAAATGRNLAEGYRRQGRWALVLYGLLTVATMFTVEAAVTGLTAAIFLAVFPVVAAPVTTAAGILIVCTALVMLGRYRWLDRIVKVAVAALSLATLIATLLVLPRLDPSGLFTLPAMTAPTLIFYAKLVGWMPSAIDISVWHSLWTLARKEDTGHAPTVRESMFDFDVGYYGTVVMALCFVVLGAAVFSGAEGALPGGAAAFARKLISVYTESLGAWSGPLIGGAAFLVMFSTTLAVVDGFPRALEATALAWDASSTKKTARGVFYGALLVLPIGSLLVLTQFKKSLPGLIDVATTLSFLTAPLLAWLNHRTMWGDDVPEEARPGPRMRLFSLLCIGLLSLFAAFWLYVRFF